MRLFLASLFDTAYPHFEKEYAFDPALTPTLYIPTAKNPYDAPCPLSEQGTYQALASRGYPITVCDLAQVSEDELSELIKPIRLVAVGGGNTYYLLWKMRESGFAKLLPTLLAHGVVYVGSSAGSAVCCPDIAYVGQHDDPSKAPGLTDYTGLNLIDVSIYPHCIEPTPESGYTADYVMQELTSPTKKIFLRDHQALVVRDDMYKIV